jgi:hypothetical protein
MPPKNAHNTWSVADFEFHRPHLTHFVCENVIKWQDNQECRRMLIHAPVKSGKREMVEYIAVRDISRHPRRKHVFISAWHRTADEEQRNELSLHNIKVYSITSDIKVDDCRRWIQEQICNGIQITIHIDECDFGSGSRQKLGKLYKNFRENLVCFFILYSATPEEVLFSGEIDDDDELYDELLQETRHGVCVNYDPPPGYCGPKKFLSEGLVEEAMPFFKKNNDGIQLSVQGDQIIQSFRNAIKDDPARNILVIRLSSSDGKRKEDKHIYQFLRGVDGCSQLDGIIIIAAKEDLKGDYVRVNSKRIEWSTPDFWTLMTNSEPIIIVIDQTASRSTEFVCHKRIFAYHEYRNQVTYTVSDQALGRMNHYSPKYGEFQRIHIYGHVKTLQLSAGQISYSQYINHEWCKKKINNEDLYHIKNTIDGMTHPDHMAAISSESSDDVLSQLGCLVKVKVSDRVRGRIKNVAEFGCDFIQCDEKSFQQNIELKLKELNIQQCTQNPFIKARIVNGQIQGYLREWAVFTFETVCINRAWGMTGPKNTVRTTVCYKSKELGVAIRWKTGKITEDNTLTTYRSMYT